MRIRLVPDRRYLKDIGQLNDGSSYWIDIQLNGEGQDTRDFVATYVFDSEGKLIDHNVVDLGLRSDPSSLSTRAVVAQERKRLGAKATSFWRNRSRDFWVKPFSVEAYGLVFGLVVREAEDTEPEGFRAVDALPGWTLMFHPPWQEGLYDT